MKSEADPSVYVAQVGMDEQITLVEVVLEPTIIKQKVF